MEVTLSDLILVLLYVLTEESKYNTVLANMYVPKPVQILLLP